MTDTDLEMKQYLEEVIKTLSPARGEFGLLLSECQRLYDARDPCPACGQKDDDCCDLSGGYDV